MKTKLKKQIVFICSDGFEFTRKKDAENHEYWISILNNIEFWKKQAEINKDAPPIFEYKLKKADK